MQEMPEHQRRLEIEFKQTSELSKSHVKYGEFNLI